MPKVSVIIPVYNVERYLRECLDSVVNQTLKDIEIICINDGSTDNSLEILKEYAKNDTRIKIIDKQNTGYGHSMNVGLDNAQGEYIGIVESDDYVDLHMYEELYNLAAEYDADIIRADFHRFYGTRENKRFVYNKLDNSDKYYNRVIDPKENLIIFRFGMFNWSGIHKRTFIEKYHIRHNETPGASYQDTGFHFQLFTRAERIYFLDKPFYYYRSDNICASCKDKGKIYFFNREFEFIQDYLERNPELKKIYSEAYWHRKFSSYLWNLKRIDLKFKKEFLKVFFAEFKQAEKNKELDYSLFRPHELKMLKLLLRSPEKFYRKSLNRLSLFQKIFSIKNTQTYGKIHKIVRICGLKFKFRNKSKEAEIKLEEQRRAILHIKAQNEKILKYLKNNASKTVY